MKITTTDQIEFQLPGARLGIIAARFNSSIVDGLLDGAMESLQYHGITHEDIELVYVPGAFEMPLIAKRLAMSNRYDGLIALGAVIRGETAHFEYVAGTCASGLAEIALHYDVPIGFGVLTVNNEQQAIARSGPDADNKGREATLAVLQMIKLLRDFSINKKSFPVSEAKFRKPL